MEGNSLNVGAEEGEPQLDIIEKQSVSAERKAGRLGGWPVCHQPHSSVSRPGLIVREGAKRVGASAKEALGQRNRFLFRKTRGSGKRCENTELRLPGQNDGVRQSVIGCIAD